MALINFDNWVIKEYQQCLKITPSVEAEGFFNFDDKPVIAINFNFVAMGLAHLSEGYGRWYALIPEKIEFPDKQIVYIDATEGKYIVTNNHCKTQEGTPVVILTNRPGRAAISQFREEIRQNLAKLHTHISPGELGRKTEEELRNERLLRMGKNNHLYHRLPNNWIYHSILTVKPVHQRTKPLGDLTPGGEVIDIAAVMEKMKYVA